MARVSIYCKGTAWERKREDGKFFYLKGQWMEKKTAGRHEFLYKGIVNGKENGGTAPISI